MPKTFLIDPLKTVIVIKGGTKAEDIQFNCSCIDKISAPCFTDGSWSLQIDLIAVEVREFNRTYVFQLPTERKAHQWKAWLDAVRAFAQDD